jgi:hypothetical protein
MTSTTQKSIVTIRAVFVHMLAFLLFYNALRAIFTILVLARWSQGALFCDSIRIITNDLYSKSFFKSWQCLH